MTPYMEDVYRTRGTRLRDDYCCEVQKNHTDPSAMSPLERQHSDRSVAGGTPSWAADIANYVTTEEPHGDEKPRLRFMLTSEQVESLINGDVSVAVPDDSDDYMDYDGNDI